jgi:hypothetical protein
MHIWLGLAAGALGSGVIASQGITAAHPTAPHEKPRQAAVPISRPASDLASWVETSGDNGGRPFLVIDKVAAAVWAFDSRGLLMGSTPALVGIATGDDSQAGVGDRELSHIPRAQRTTPAGRFVASFGRAAGGHNVLWVDYATAVSLHPVITANKAERRLERLRSATSEDNRITFGCINVPPAFYGNVVRPLIAKASAIVYILPDTNPVDQVFPGVLAGQSEDVPQPKSDAAASTPL